MDPPTEGDAYEFERTFTVAEVRQFASLSATLTQSGHAASDGSSAFAALRDEERRPSDERREEISDARGRLVPRRM
ncbi:hypothetical protein SAMN04488063_1410 [Halopelagius inordinatus]|uniref:Uncharacterized protein n=1 Tax=Halopelagius inordinatus TaxID=553467 RepID=A0A1I2P0G5_9EURY|nr:hypothetical protein [Halopelagius inordinatus]SFG09735.1 hypothetical protein SAMN04488063_1410 [Halopelagius inordinatus]